jgi:hypothetical protein
LPHEVTRAAALQEDSDQEGMVEDIWMRATVLRTDVKASHFRSRDSTGMSPEEGQ